MQIQLKTHQQVNILLRLLSAEEHRLETHLLANPGMPAFGKAHIQNELDVVQGLYRAVYNASTTPDNRI